MPRPALELSAAGLASVACGMEIQTWKMNVPRGRVASGDYAAAFRSLFSQVEGHQNVLGGGAGYARRVRGARSPERGDPILFAERWWIDDGQ